MGIDDAINAIREFFLEFLGFLLPGFTLLSFSYLFITAEYKSQIDPFLHQEYSNTIILFVSYILGYVLFGISDAWKFFQEKGRPSLVFKFLRSFRLIGVKPYSEIIQQSIKNSPEYDVALNIICEKIGIEKNKLELMKFTAIRNIAMSYIPEADVKIYNFMFRAELSDKVIIALKIVFFLGITSICTEMITGREWLFKTNHLAIWGYITAIITTFFLRRTQKRFFEIAMRIAIPIFVVKHKM